MPVNGPAAREAPHRDLADVLTACGSRRDSPQRPSNGRTGLFSGLPAQDWFAGGGYFVKAADARRVRSSLYQVGAGIGFSRDGAHGVNEKVAFLLRFGFGGLDHHGARNDEREGSGVRMEAVIDEALGDVHGVYA